MTTPQKPNTKQQRRAEIQAKNPLDTLPDNLGSADTGAAPDEFRMHVGVDLGEDPNADGIERAFSQADVDAAVARAVDTALNAPKYTETQMQEMLARARAEAAAPALEAATVPLTPEQEATAGHISTSGRAPHIEAKDRVWIILDDNDEIPPGGQFISVNGVGYQLLAGVEAFVPRAVCEVLDHAVKSMPVVDNNTKRIIGWKNRKRFPYTIITKGHEAALEA